jgi:hypothetical protein
MEAYSQSLHSGTLLRYRLSAAQTLVAIGPTANRAFCFSSPQYHSRIRDILLPMTYRRGFQRAYAVVVVAWVAFVLLGTPSERLRFWDRSVDFGGIANRYGGVSANPTFSDIVLEKFPYPDHLGTRTSKLVWLTEAVILPPVLGYVLLFHISRWVYRGFRPLAQI